MAADTSSPLYLHPNDGSYSITVDKLTRAADYRSWRRSMEITLSSKKKLGFVTGTILRSSYGANTAQKEQWDTCNAMFLNGLDDCFAPMRSHILMLTPLPTVETACSMLQQEESQREVLGKSDTDISAMYGRNSGFSNTPGSSAAVRIVVCSACGRRVHGPDKCWTIVGYPAWHHKHKSINNKQNVRAFDHMTSNITNMVDVQPVSF
uniref:Retrotransposon Copia-like N-terminal domain-containing protein n=1 Tax=Chenopodium quinoa TaxID=63459 RepID=A0A803MQ79_CHEQI